MHKGYLAGVQCKDRDEQLGRRLTTAEVDTECANARQFTPQISEFTIATTAPRDANIQQHVREANANETHDFKVHVWSWDEIQDEIRYRPQMLNAYYGEIDLEPGNPAEVRMSPSTYRDHCAAFFSRPAMHSIVTQGLREHLIPLCYELSDNAYKYGEAAHFSIRCSGASIAFADNGKAFDPLTNLDPTKVTARSHIGSYMLKRFQVNLKDLIREVRYERTKIGEEEWNQLVIEFVEETGRLDIASTEALVVNLSQAVGRRNARDFGARLILPTQKEVVINLGRVGNMSMMAEFTTTVLERLPADAKLTVRIDRNPYTDDLASWFKDDRLTVRVQ